MSKKNKESENIIAAYELLERIKGNPLKLSERMDLSIKLASHILDEGNRIQTFKEKRVQNQLQRMMSDPEGKVFTTRFTDQCFRSKKFSRVADQVCYLIDSLGIPKYFSPMKRFGLLMFRWFGKPLSFIFVPMTIFLLRQETSATIIAARKLRKHICKRRSQGVRTNINRLGEALLGEAEALARVEKYLADLRDPDIEYISIKISTIYSKINLLAMDKTLKVLSHRLALLYQAAIDNPYTNEQGVSHPKFVNLDMEEYKDLHITKELFMRVLERPEFKNYPAGIVLQAYIPDSFRVQEELTVWAKKRLTEGGAPIKIRLVKGANLQPEQHESSLHHWPQPQYQTKAEVDANYKRMVTYGCHPENARAVTIGIGSHNIFDIAYALVLRAENSISDCIVFEMLEGMADNIRRVVQKISGSMLLYCPVAAKEDFQNAVAYLIRRLDENTGAENFLRHAWGLKVGQQAWKEQADRFRISCEEMNAPSLQPRRNQDRAHEEHHENVNSGFHSDIETNFSLLANQQWAMQLLHEAKELKFDVVPLVIDGKVIENSQKRVPGFNPSEPTKPLYETVHADSKLIDQALTCAQKAQIKWNETSFSERAQLLHRVANLIRKNRGKLFQVMMLDGGKTFYEADPEVSEAIDFANYYAECALQMQAHEDLEWSGKGTFLVASPWNFPVAIPLGGILGALAAGNSVIFKPAPEAVLCGWTMVNLLWEAGIPRDVLQFVNCPDDPVGSQMIKDERLSGVILTGATSTAKKFLEMRPNLNLIAETGGKNSLIISAMSDRDLAVKDLIQSAFGHSGQKCSAASLGILEAEVYKDKNFLSMLKDAVESLPYGPASMPDSVIIPLVAEPSDALMKALSDKDSDIEWLLKPEQSPDNPNLWRPGIAMNVKESSFLHQTELFGPVLALMKAKDLKEAIRFANGTPYGLTSGLHSLDKREQEYWIEHIEAGNQYINRTTTGARVNIQPFGGMKASSFGQGIKAGGPHYVAQFAYAKQKPGKLPKQKWRITHYVNRLSEFLSGVELTAEEEALWEVSRSNYAYYWTEEFERWNDPSRIVGQDNFQIRKPAKKVAFRISEQDTLIDIYRVLAAALTCRCKLEVSYDACAVKFNKKWKNTFPLTFIRESETSFAKRIESGAFERIRLLTLPSNALQLAASKCACTLISEPLLANGSYELVHYVQEVALSINYHRYGYLGLRENENRAPIL